MARNGIKIHFLQVIHNQSKENENCILVKKEKEIVNFYLIYFSNDILPIFFFIY